MTTARRTRDRRRTRQRVRTPWAPSDRPSRRVQCLAVFKTTASRHAPRRARLGSTRTLQRFPFASSHTRCALRSRARREVSQRRASGRAPSCPTHHPHSPLKGALSAGMRHNATDYAPSARGTARRTPTVRASPRIICAMSNARAVWRWRATGFDHPRPPRAVRAGAAPALRAYASRPPASAPVRPRTRGLPTAKQSRAQRSKATPFDESIPAPAVCLQRLAPCSPRQGLT